MSGFACCRDYDAVGRVGPAVNPADSHEPAEYLERQLRALLLAIWSSCLPEPFVTIGIASSESDLLRTRLAISQALIGDTFKLPSGNRLTGVGD